MDRKTALITGSSRGLGFEFARLFAADGYDLVCVARNGSELKERAATISDSFKVKVEVIHADLSKPAALAEISSILKEKKICPDALVNNAGFGMAGYFHKLDLNRQIEMINVNISALTGLCRLVLPAMIERKSGHILNVASTAAFFSGPLMSVYYASKVFVLYFSNALREEVRGRNITVSTLCPGPTKTSFDEVSGMGNTLMQRKKLVPSMSADFVASVGYKGLKAGKRVIVPGIVNKTLAVLSRVLPMSVTSRIIMKMNTIA